MPVATTHELTFSPDTVTKCYRRWGDGEPQREWDALTLIHARAPDLVPEPLTCDLDAEPPQILMSRLPGEPVGTGSPVSAACLDAVARALDTFHSAVPGAALTARPPRRWGLVVLLDTVRSWAVETAASPVDVPQAPEVRRALDDGISWLTRPDFERLDAAPSHPVFGSGDGNLANLLWDGDLVRLVDFEDAGVSDRTYELADMTEHVSTWVDGTIDPESLLDRFSLTVSERTRLLQYRRLFGLFWLLMLLPGNPAARRNPEGTLQRQAVRLATLLGSD